jgi:hypothetical protein
VTHGFVTPDTRLCLSACPVLIEFFDQYRVFFSLDSRNTSRMIVTSMTSLTHRHHHHHHGDNVPAEVCT